MACASLQTQIVVFQDYKRDIEFQMESVNAWKKELAGQIAAFSDEKSELARNAATKHLTGYIIAHLRKEDKKAQLRLMQLHKKSQNAWLHIFRLKQIQQKMMEEYFSMAKGLEHMEFITVGVSCSA